MATTTVATWAYAREQNTRSTGAFWWLIRTERDGSASTWAFKPYPKTFRAEIEHAAAILGRFWGFSTPDSQLITFDGMYGVAQRRVPDAQDMAGGAELGFYTMPVIDWRETSLRTMRDLAAEHVLDWMLDNDDSRASNLLMTPDGHVVGIDKSRAWRHFGSDYPWPGLSGDGRMNTNCAVVVSALYAAIRTRQVDYGTACRIYLHTAETAQRVQASHELYARVVIASGIANRPHTTDNQRAALIDAVIARKRTVVQDFRRMWEVIFHDAGWTLPE